MTNQRHETVLSYKLDGRGLREARKEFERTFSPMSAKEMNRALADMKGMLRALTSEQVRLNAEFARVKEGTAEYERLEKALGRVEKQAERVRSSMAGLRESGGDERGRGAFSQGFLQGMSPLAAGIIDRGPGARAQYAGQLVGHAVRGGVARVGGLFQGGGPLGTLMQGVPILGGLANMAEGAVEQARAYDAARMQAFPFLAGGGSAGLARIERARGAARRANPVPGIDENRMLDVGQAAAGAAFSDDAMRLAKMDYPDAGPTELRIRAKSLEEKIRNAPGSGRFVMQRVMDAQKDELAKQSEAAKQALDQQKKAVSEATSGSIRSMTGDLSGLGMRAGLDATSMFQLAGSVGRQVGTTDIGMLEQVLAAERLGVDQSTSGGFFRQQRRGRGGSSARGEDALATAIAEATALGLEGSEVNEHLSRLVSLQESAEQSGLKLSVEGFNALAAAFKGAGLDGLQAGRVAGGFTSYGQRVAAGGMSGPVDTLLMRSVGFRPGGGASNYVNALQRAEGGLGGLGPQELFTFLSGITSGMGSVEDKEALAGQKLTLKRVFGQMGTSISLEQAEQLARGVAAGPDGFNPSAILGTKDALVEQGLDGDAARALSASLRSQAGIANQLVAAGHRAMPLVDRLNSNAAELATHVAGISKIIERGAPYIESISEKLGVLLDRLVEWGAGGQTPMLPGDR